MGYSAARVEPEGAPEPQAQSLVYVNWIRVGSSPFELSLDLGYRANPAPPGEFPVSAVMTWEQAKQLRGLLDDAIESYESDVGPIRDLGGEIVPARPAGQVVPISDDVEEV